MMVDVHVNNFLTSNNTVYSASNYERPQFYFVFGAAHGAQLSPNATGSFCRAVQAHSQTLNFFSYINVTGAWALPGGLCLNPQALGRVIRWVNLSDRWGGQWVRGA